MHLTNEARRAITDYVDIHSPPPKNTPTALLIFGTNQPAPADMAAELHHRGHAPLIIATGGINRHNGVIEGQMFHRLLRDRDVPESAIRYEDRSSNTQQNIENALSYINEALAADLPITAISKWFHRRTISLLATLVPNLNTFHALGWEPIYANNPVTRENWHETPDGHRRVTREWTEVTRRTTEGTLSPTSRTTQGWTRTA
ncbi:YdcF family protein [Actinomadura atramentaria]|uniref:YdcF family protein n=1 Tax=Actinomadura atramentaria TaxID=1990 RepID=UPI0009FD5860|nr:YdcF family protein [Actinomadura atramentaria]